MNYTVIIKLCVSIDLTINEINLIKKLTQNNSIIRLHRKLLILHDVKLTEYDLCGLFIISSSFNTFITKTENFDVGSYNDYDNDQNNMWDFWMSLHPATFIDKFDIVENSNQNYDYDYEIRSNNNWGESRLYLLEHKYGSARKIFKFVNLIRKLLLDDDPKKFVIYQRKIIKFDDKYDIFNQFEFNINNQLIIFDEEMLKYHGDDYIEKIKDEYNVDHSEIKKGYKEITLKNDKLFDNSNFILNLYIVYIEIGLPFEMIIIIFGYL